MFLPVQLTRNSKLNTKKPFSESPKISSIEDAFVVQRGRTVPTLSSVARTSSPATQIDPDKHFKERQNNVSWSWRKFISQKLWFTMLTFRTQKVKKGARLIWTQSPGVCSSRSRTFPLPDVLVTRHDELQLQVDGQDEILLTTRTPLSCRSRTWAAPRITCPC